jgi:protein-S-isoprenylcysteine O-methyltransferase Ste14
MPVTSSGWFWILLATGLYGLVHSILASVRVKTWVAQKVGQVAYQRYYRLAFVIIGALTAIPLLVLVAWLPDQVIYRLPAPWAYLAYSLQAIAALLALISIVQTGLMRFIGFHQALHLDRSEQTETLVTTGLYRWVRHPIYSASFLFLWAAPVMTGNLLALNLGLSFYLWIGSIFEEKKLLQQFGKAYEAYRWRTPRFVPRLKQ